MPEQPNILFVLTDQMRADCLSCTGHPVVRTPNLDEVARRGAVFSAAYSPCPSCIAARASIWTGLTPSAHGRIGYQDCVPWRYDGMLPGLLGRAGYQTHCVGKTHFYPQRSHCGFDSLESYEAHQNFDGLYVNDYFEWLRERTGRAFVQRGDGLDSNSWVARPSHLPEELHNNSWVAERGVEFLRRRDPTRPFFLNLSFHRPHAPLDPPQVFWDLYRDRDIPPVPVGDWAAVHDVPTRELNAWHGRIGDDLLADARRAYYAQIAHIDSQVGRVLRAMTDLKVGPTWVVFTADHGEMLGDHHLWRKTYAYEGSAGVPLIVQPPAGWGRGGDSDGEQPGSQPHVCDAPVVLQDLYPTFLQIAGAEPPERTEGLSLLPLVSRERDRTHEFVHGEHARCYSREMAMQYLTDGCEKYVWYTVTGQEQLFDLREDPDELHDLAAEPAAAKRVRAWRSRMVDLLAKRPQDGLSDGKELIAGQALPAVREGLLSVR